jgi:predicted RNase H-like HicB family nuclease
MCDHTGYIIVTMRVHHDAETNQFVADCEELGVSTCADTLEEAFAAVEEAATLYLGTVEELGERERIFAKRGIAIQEGPLPSESKPVPTALNEFVLRRSLDVSTLAFA